MSKSRIALLAASLAALGALGACTENPQLVDGQKMGHAVVQRDTPPWQGEPLPFQTQYTRGDEKSWEKELTKRVQGQNEYIRIGG
jgi:hypothetical protein